VDAGSSDAITDNTGNSWTLSSGNTVLENGSAAGYSANVAALAYVDGAVWQENTAGNWWSWTDSGWAAGNNPLTATTTPASSSNDTVILAGSTQAITDNTGNSWTVSSGNTVLENGSAAGYTANVAEIAYVNGQVWTENTSGGWYSWTGSAWAGSGDPLSASGAPTGGSDPLPAPGAPSGGSDPLPAPGAPSGGSVSDNSVGSSLNLTGYHLSFDWEANNFPNSPTPQSGSFTTTLSSGLRYLGNGDQEYWADSSTGQNPFQLDNGALDINATYVGAGNTPGGGSLSYDSGLFTTQGMFSQQYGYFEMRAELPAGAGMWPAFWMLDDNSAQPGAWPTELDAVEAFGAPNANGEGGTSEAHWDVHSQNTSQQAGNWVNINADEASGYHTYGVLWTPTQMSFVYDGQVMAEAPTPSDYTQEMYMIVNLAVGGTWPGDATGENGTMKVDYLRAYSSDTSVPAAALQTISSPDGGGTSFYGASVPGH
jgi:beta-glucanase (GH16 family)